MQRPMKGSPGKAYYGGFAAGLARGRDEREAEVRQLEATLESVRKQRDEAVRLAKEAVTLARP